MDTEVLILANLGGPGSGKSTIFKQMNDADYVNFRYLVHSNVVQAICQLLRAAEEFNYPVDDNLKVKQAMEFFRAYKEQVKPSEIELSYELTKAIRIIYNAQFIKSTLLHKDEIELFDSAQ
uniref:AAA_28 domain-containing protein n=1 Tax=Heterorhabditis bacteriophora TaxID=37862 RepID=A0A1I7WW94_HETBA